MDIKLTSNPGEGMNLHVDAAEVHYSAAVAPAAGPFRTGPITLHAVGSRFQGDPPAVHWDCHWQSGFRRWLCRRSDWQDGEERWITIAPLPGAVISIGRLVYGNDPGGRAGTETYRFVEGVGLVPAVLSPAGAPGGCDTRVLRRRVEDRLRKGSEGEVYTIAQILGVKLS